MKKTFLIALTLGGLTGCLGFIANQQPADAAAWQVIKTKDYTHSRSALSTPYYVNKKSNVYMWNLHHTKRLHNLKNYPRTSFWLEKSVELRQGTKRKIFYRV
ncbi:D-alanyl-D-alanine carboxypeptidase, partial [Lentilactobacillus diolivorans]|nr:D-alanyl-D-alanine carboxypeptidase [Lentilactobacillus diolivorans]